MCSTNHNIKHKHLDQTKKKLLWFLLSKREAVKKIRVFIKPGDENMEHFQAVAKEHGIKYTNLCGRCYLCETNERGSNTLFLCECIEQSFDHIDKSGNGISSSLTPKNINQPNAGQTNLHEPAFWRLFI